MANCARELLDAVPPLFWYIRKHMRQHRQGLSVPQFRALIKIRNEPETSLSAVAEHLGSTLPTASRTVSKLVSKGLLSRCGSPKDRRQCALTLTPRGRQLVETALAATQSKMESELAHFTPRQRAIVREAVTLLGDAFKEARNREAMVAKIVTATMSRRRLLRSPSRNGAVATLN